MSEEKAIIETQEEAIIENKKDVNTIDEGSKGENVNQLSNMSIETLILQMNQLSESKDILSESKQGENIRSVFYQKLKQTNKNIEEEGDKSSERKLTLHPLEIEFKRAYNKFQKEKAKGRKKKEKEEQENLKIKQGIIKDLQKLTNQEELLEKPFEQFRMLQKKWRDTGHVPIAQNNSLWQSYHHHVEIFYDYIKINNDLRDLDFKRNLEEKTRICQKAEALINEKSLNKMHENLQELHEHWRNIGPVKKELREEIWERFQMATKLIHKKRNDYFLKKKEENDTRLKAKNVICKKINALTENPPNTHNEWQNLITKCRALEDKWKEIGKLNKKDNKTGWDNLRKSLDHFYETKNAFYKNRKNNTKKAIQEKLKLCEKAEALKDSTAWKDTTQQLIKLQENWKKIGFSPKQETDKIWKRFNAALDTFFNSKKQYFKTLENAKEKNLVAKQKLLKEIEKKFEAIMNKHFDSIQMDKVDVTKEKFRNKITTISGNKLKLKKERSFILSRINEQEQIIAQYENNISFFGKSKSNEALKQEVIGKIKSAKDQIVILKEKLKIIDSH